MTEPRVDATTPSNATTSFLLDGDEPRLGGAGAPQAHAAPFAAPTASAATVATVPRAAAPSPMLSAPGSAAVLAAPPSPSLSAPATTVPPPAPSSVAPIPAPVEPASGPGPAVDLPTLPTVSPAAHQAVPAASGTETPTPAGSTEHPMAHLMPQKSAPSEASTRAAELRAAKKAKSRKIKIGVAIGAIVMAAIAGPPLGKWLVDAINEAGSTSTDVEG